MEWAFIKWAIVVKNQLALEDNDASQTFHQIGASNQMFCPIPRRLSWWPNGFLPEPEDGVHLLLDQVLDLRVGGAGIVLGVDVVGVLAELKQRFKHQS